MEIGHRGTVWNRDRNVHRSACAGASANWCFGLCPADSFDVYPCLDAEESILCHRSLVVRVLRYYPCLEQVCLSYRFGKLSDNGTLLFRAVGVVCAEH